MSVLSRRNALYLLGFTAGFAWIASASVVADDKVALAIKGYDPVAYFTMGKAVRGSPEFELQWDEHRYYFARPDHRQMFQSAPERYAPQFMNVCAMALALGKIVEADPESWLISDGKLYIFGGPAGRDLFQQALAENVAKANNNRGLIQKR